ncbi:hypothetical protein BofuT4_P000930.1 [Botrytis cinerea T4]|uniref:Uncharacterized protein n=1 Tax=Botryotinia fuckeliana (strain T4) TaxID=999810 RepID=G2YLZ8_BOTF4|nr:hypothetical protein BofuT4_P000930.1 [Botrytis cinerea T4]
MSMNWPNTKGLKGTKFFVYTLTSAGGFPCMNLNESLLFKYQSGSFGVQF